MSFSSPKEQTPSPFALRYFLVLFVLTLLLVLRLFWPFLPILILSFLLAGLFQPIQAFFSRRMSPRLASLITCFLIILVVFVPLGFFVGALSREAYELYQVGKGANLGAKLRELLQGNVVLVKLQEMLANYGLSLKPEAVSQAFNDFTKAAGLFLYNKASNWAANVMNFLFNFFMMIITIFFLLTDHERLMAYIQRLLPMPGEQSRNLLDKFEEIAGAVLIGNGVCGLLQGVLGGLVFYFLNLGPPILWGGIMSILAFLPIFGIGLVFLPAAVIMLFKGSIWVAVFLLVFYIVLSFGVEYLLKPKMVGEQVQMHTLLVFLSIIGGLSVFGFLGIIYGPLIITAFLAMAEIYLVNFEWYMQRGALAGRDDLRQSGRGKEKGPDPE